MQKKYFLQKTILFLGLCFGFLHAESLSSPFHITGTLHIPTADGAFRKARLDGVLATDACQKLLKELLEEHNWFVEHVDEKHGRIISPEPEIIRSIYDIDTSFSTATIDLTVAQTTHAAPIISVAMHPSGDFVLIGGTTAATGNHQSRIYALSSTGSALTAMTGCNQIYGGPVNGVAWHPTGRFYALVGTVTAQQNYGLGTGVYRTSARIYGFDSSAVTSTVLPYAYIDHGATLTVADWHPTGSYLAVGGPGGTDGSQVRVYSFNGAQLTQLPNCNMSVASSSTVVVGALSWHPSGDYLAVGSAPGTGSLDIRVYYFTNDALLEMASARFDTGSTTSDLAWSPDGTMLAAVTTGGTLQLLSFDNQLRLVSRDTAAHGAGLNSAAWSPDGGYIVVGGVESGAVVTSRIYQVQEQTLTEITACQENHNATVWNVDWSKDGSFITVGGYSSGGFTLETYQFTEELRGVVKKNKGMLYAIDSLIRDAYDDLTTAEETVYTTSDAMSTANPWYLMPESSRTEIPFNPWPWIIGGTGLSDFNDLDSHPNGRLIAAVSKNSDTPSAPGWINLFEFDPTGTAVQTQFVPKTSYFYPQNPTNVISNVRWSPSGNYLIVTQGEDSGYSPNFVNSPAWIFKYDGTALSLSSTQSFYCWGYASLSPNDSFILTTSSVVPARVLSFDGNFTQSYGSVPFSGSDINPFPSPFGSFDAVWAPDGQSFALSLDSSLNSFQFEHLDFNPATGAITELLSTRVSDMVGLNDDRSIAIRPQADDTDPAAYVAISHLSQVRIYRFNGVNAAVPSYTILPGCSKSVLFGATIRTMKWSKNGQYLAVYADNVARVFIYEFVENTYLKHKATLQGVFVQNSAFWFYNDMYFATGTEYFSLNFNNHQKLLVDTSNAAAGLLVATSYAVAAKGTLNRTTSNAIVTWSRLAVETSNAMVTYQPVIIGTSNAVNAILPGTSNALANLERTTSNAIVTLAAGTGLNQTTSSAIVTLFPILIDTSNAMNNYQPLIVATSNAVNGLLVATSNAMAGLLVATSNAAAGLLVATSNAAAGLLVADSNAAVRTANAGIALKTVDCGPANIHFSSATITLTYDLFISADHQLQIHTSGVVNGNGHAINFPRSTGTALTVDAGITVTFQNLALRNYVDARVSLGANAAVIFGQGCTVELGDAQDLSRTWSFAGYSRVKGFNTRLGVGTGQNYIAVQPQSNVKLEGLYINNIRDNNIRCLNNNSSIWCQNVDMLFSGDYSFTAGSIEYTGDVTLGGSSVFNYQTNMGSTIDSGSKVAVSQGMALNYAPGTNFRNLLVMTDSTSVLSFNNATLVSTATGIQLKKGTLLVDGVMTIQSAAASSAEAVIFGDGTPANDLIIKLMPGAGVQVTSGYLNYQNAN